MGRRVGEFVRGEGAGCRRYKKVELGEGAARLYIDFTKELYCTSISYITPRRERKRER